MVVMWVVMWVAMHGCDVGYYALVVMCGCYRVGCDEGCDEGCHVGCNVWLIISCCVKHFMLS